MRMVRYQALGPLLAGERSRAFLGLEISDEGRARPVVLVWVPEEVSEDPERRAVLEQETARAAAMQHPNLVRVYGLAAMEGGLARVVEYLDGESLRRMLSEGGRLPPPLAAFVAAEAALGIHYAHLTGAVDGRPWVHGDVRPETVMVGFSGVCKVAGYGALGVAPAQRPEAEGLPEDPYRAPEQRVAGREASTQETDVFLLGLLLYECITGEPVASGDAETLVSRPLPDANFDEIPLELVAVIQRATAQKAFDRYPTVLAFREALEEALGALPTQEELSAWLFERVPSAASVRSSRRRQIDAGIAQLSVDAGALEGEPELDGLSERVEIRETRPGLPALVKRPRQLDRGGARPSLRELALEQARASGLRPFSPSTWAPDAGRVRASGVAVVLRQGEAAPGGPEPSGSPSAGSSGAALSSGTAPSGGTGASETSEAEGGSRGSGGSRAAARAREEEAALTRGPRRMRRPAWLIPMAVGASLAFGVTGWLAFFERTGSDATPPGALASADLAAAGDEAGQGPDETSAAAEVAASAQEEQAASPKRAARKARAPGKAPVRRVSHSASGASGRDAAPAASRKRGPRLALTVDPPVEVMLGRRKLGRTPLEVPMPEGRHLLWLRDKNAGIDTTHSVVVEGSGVSYSELVLGRGYLSLKAPDGAAVWLDGKRIGTTPIPDTEIYEGQHHIKVNVSGADWEQTFAVKDGETMYFTVETYQK